MLRVLRHSIVRVSQHHFISTELPLRLGPRLRIETVDALLSRGVSYAPFRTRASGACKPTWQPLKLVAHG